MNHRLLATKQQQQQQPQDQPPQEFNPSSTIIPSTTTLTAALSHSPPPVVYLKNVCAWNVETLKELHLALFPVHYSDTFYQQVQNVGEFAKVVYLDDQAVGAICCRIEPELLQEGKYRVYIMTLGVLAPYRRRRLGHLLLEHIVHQAQLEPTITRIYLHVQTLNTPALAFYHGHGFQKVALARDYYKNIPNKDAYVVVRNIPHGDPSS